MNIRVVIAEDEEPALCKLRGILQRIDCVTIVGEASNGRSAIEIIQSTRPDAAFMDIQMPQVDGFGVIRELPAPPKIVFVTAHSKHAVSAFEHQAFDYLLKPYTAARVHGVITRLEHELKMERLAILITGEAQVAPSPTKGPENPLILKAGSDMTIIAAEDIECVIAEGNYLHVMTAKRKFFVRGVLSEIERMLPSQHFLRVHRSALLNIPRLTTASFSEYIAVTSSGYKVPISRARTHDLRNALEQLGVPTIGSRGGA